MQVVLDAHAAQLAERSDQRPVDRLAVGTLAQLLHQELDIMARIAEETRAKPQAITELSDADLVAQIAADVAALPPAVRARVQASTSGPSLRLVGSRKTTA